MPVAHNVIRISGVLPGGEVWSVNPKFAGGDTGPVDDYVNLLAWVEGIGLLNSGNVLSNGLRAMLSLSGWVTQIRGEFRDDTGTLVQAAEYVLPSPAAGTGTASKPFQTSLVSSLLTGRPGRSYRGRLYWPALGVAVVPTDLRIADGNLATYTNDIADFLSDVQMAVPFADGPVLSVVSDTLSVATPVTEISCGDVLDVQRRRRDSLIEGRINRPFPPP